MVATFPSLSSKLSFSSYPPLLSSFLFLNSYWENSSGGTEREKKNVNGNNIAIWNNYKTPDSDNDVRNLFHVKVCVDTVFFFFSMRTCLLEFPRFPSHKREYTEKIFLNCNPIIWGHAIIHALNCICEITRHSSNRKTT